MHPKEDNFKDVLSEHAVCSSQWQYSKGLKKEHNQHREHCIGSKALLLMLMSLCWTSQQAGDVKKNALKVLNGLVGTCVSSMGLVNITTTLLFVVQTQTLAATFADTLSFTIDSNGRIGSLAEVAAMLGPKFAKQWATFQSKSYLGWFMCSPLVSAHLFDFLLMAIWAKCHSKTCSWWSRFFCQAVTKIVHWLAKVWESTVKIQLCSVQGESDSAHALLPTLRLHTRRRRADFYNKMTLKLAEGAKQAVFNSIHRSSLWNDLDARCLLYVARAKQLLEGCQHFSCNWDPSTHSGEDTFIGMIYSWTVNIAAHMPVQVISHSYGTTTVCTEIQQLARERKLKRCAAFCHIRALLHSLKLLGIAFLTFTLPEDVMCRPLLPSETRVLHEGMWYIYNALSGACLPQLGSLGKLLFFSLKLMTMTIDQGSVGSTAMAYAMRVLCLLVHVRYDAYHRVWNDLKLALKKCKLFLWEAVLHSVLIFNLGYGPFGSSAWFPKKQEWLSAFLQDRSHTSPAFRSSCPMIAAERGVAEPHTEEQYLAMYETLKETPHILTKGPMCKLARWFSYFECLHFYSGWIAPMKLFLLHAKTTDEDFWGSIMEEDTDLSRSQAPKKTAESAAAKLSALRKKQSALKLAPDLICMQLLAKLKVIGICGNKLWTQCFDHIRMVKTPQDNLVHMAKQLQGAWQKELLELVQETCCTDWGALMRLQCPALTGDELADGLVDFLLHILGNRAISQAVMCSTPPYRHGLVMMEEPMSTQAMVSLKEVCWDGLFLVSAGRDMKGTRCRVQSLDFRVEGLIIAPNFEKAL